MRVKITRTTAIVLFMTRAYSIDATERAGAKSVIDAIIRMDGCHPYRGVSHNCSIQYDKGKYYLVGEESDINRCIQQISHTQLHNHRGAYILRERKDCEPVKPTCLHSQSTCNGEDHA